MAPRKALIAAFLGLGALFGFVHAFHGGHRFGPRGHCHGAYRAHGEHGERYDSARQPGAPSRPQIHHHYY